ncbi:LysE family translocator [Aestuariispira insulae]|uniref:Threonine/homoserine/homoserine lactone efflux protein n=1 Tax=Aestuariispira insulae TaxID=1461337 RepID=A0A3D9HRB3_9PROT|nr:LysE family translocator [Aestuariispira insulae]RED51989.1 threonine/homoserine/homoserine lactone efflux protein [Aestuariispira insulae]
MSLELWLSFVVASLALLVIPGPTVMLVISYVLGRGRKSALATVPGVALGDLTAMTISLAGAGAVLAASATLFTVLKLIGGAYLLFLGVQLWRSAPAENHLEPTEPDQDVLTNNTRKMFWNAFLVTALNPKGIVFFIAFVPQFVDPAAPALAQFALLEFTFVGLATLVVTCWAMVAGGLRAKFRKPTTLKWVNRIGGSFLMGAGLLTAVVRRAT